MPDWKKQKIAKWVFILVVLGIIGVMYATSRPKTAMAPIPESTPVIAPSAPSEPVQMNEPLPVEVEQAATDAEATEPTE